MPVPFEYPTQGWWQTAQAQTLPEMDPGEAREAWKRWDKDLPPGVFSEPQNAEAATKMIDKYGHMFLGARGKGVKELLNKLPDDIEAFRLPSKDIHTGEEKPEEKRLIYFRKKLPMV